MSDQFDILIRSLPYTPTSQQGTGMLPPFIRAIGHLLFTLAAINEQRCEVLTGEERLNELRAASVHLQGITDDTLANLSRAATAHLRAFRDATNLLVVEWDTWTPEQRNDNLQHLSHRASGLASFLDRELLGLTAAQTDPGRSL